jgi:hypothetical protein
MVDCALYQQRVRDFISFSDVFITGIAKLLRSVTR